MDKEEILDSIKKDRRAIKRRLRLCYKHLDKLNIRFPKRIVQNSCVTISEGEGIELLVLCDKAIINLKRVHDDIIQKILFKKHLLEKEEDTANKEV